LLTGKRHKSGTSGYIISDQNTSYTPVTQKRVLPTSADSLSYMFITRKGCRLNWLAVPDTIVIRHTSFQFINDVVAIALQDGVNVIDATKTISVGQSLTSNQNISMDSITVNDWFNCYSDIRLKTVRILDSEVFVIYI